MFESTTVAQNEEDSNSSFKIRRALESTWQGVDEGPEAAAWWTRYLDMPARFVRFDPGDLSRHVYSCILYPNFVRWFPWWFLLLNFLWMLFYLSCNHSYVFFICMRELGALQEPRQAELAPNGYTTGFVNTGQFLFASEVPFRLLPHWLTYVSSITWWRMMRSYSSYIASFSFQWVFDLLQASLDKVNTYFPDAPVQMNRFRPKYTTFNLLKDLHLLNSQRFHWHRVF